MLLLNLTLYCWHLGKTMHHIMYTNNLFTLLLKYFELLIAKSYLLIRFLKRS